MPFHDVYRLHLDGMRWERIATGEQHRRFEFRAENTTDDFDGPGAKINHSSNGQAYCNSKF